MAGNGDQKKKLLMLIRMFEEETDAGQGITMTRIIERFAEAGLAVERKAVYRDIAVLRESGMNIVKLRTRPVSYAYARTDLDLADITLLVDAVQSSPFLTERKSNQLVKSLKGLVSKRERALLDKRVHVRDRVKSQNASAFGNVDAIHEAMQQKRKIEFKYFSYGTDMKRRARKGGQCYVVTPVKVVYAEGNYYLAAYSDEQQGMRTYRIDRMEALKTSEQRAARNATIANYAFEEFAYRRFSMFSGEDATVTMRVNAAMMNAVVDRFGRDVELAESAGEYAMVRVRVQVSPQFFGWIAGLDGEVRIQSPRTLAAEYSSWLKGLAAQADGALALAGDGRA